MSVTGNDTVVEAWNTVLFEKFLRFQDILVSGLSSHSDELLSRGLHEAGSKVLDIGCGFGDSTLRIARAIGPDGEAAGVDCAENFVQAARNESERTGTGNASFFVADVQHGDLQGPYDAAFSRFGTMFFMMPGLAMRNIRKALRPGASFHQIVWRKREDNPWVHKAEMCVREIVPVVDHSETEEVHCGPGPFSMSSPDVVSAMLKSAGFNQISFERFDSDIRIGNSLDEAVEFAMALGPAGEIIRLAGDEGERLRPEVTAALHDVLSEFERDDGVWAPSSTWFVSARNPAH